MCAPAKHDYTTTYYVPSGGQPPYVLTIAGEDGFPARVRITWSENILENPENDSLMNSFLLEEEVASQYSLPPSPRDNFMIGWTVAPSAWDKLEILAGAVISAETGLPNDREIWEFTETGNGAGIGVWNRISGPVNKVENA